VSRDRPAELPVQVPLQTNAVAAAKREHFDRRAQNSAKSAATIAAIVAFDFFNMLGRMRGSTAPQLIGRRARSTDTIVAELRDFYSQRPRPWISPNARARALRGAGRRRIVYDRVARREARCL
jgi:hypothetical protein